MCRERQSGVHLINSMGSSSIKPGVIMRPTYMWTHTEAQLKPSWTELLLCPSLGLDGPAKPVQPACRTTPISLRTSQFIWTKSAQTEGDRFSPIKGPLGPATREVDQGLLEFFSWRRGADGCSYIGCGFSWRWSLGSSTRTRTCFSK